MIRKLRGRRVIAATDAETFRGTVTHVGLLFIRLEPFEVAVGDTFRPGDGAALVRRRLINWLQVL